MTTHLPSTSCGITLVRINLGLMWLAHSLLALLGGLALLSGVHARQVSLLQTPLMAVTAWVHAPQHRRGLGVPGVPDRGFAFAPWLMGDGAFALRRSAGAVKYVNLLVKRGMQVHTRVPTIASTVARRLHRDARGSFQV